MFGTISSALVLSTARVEGLAEFTSSSKQAKGVCDGGHVDDGLALVRAALFCGCALWTCPPFLRRDARDPCGGNAKSSARLLCPPERRHEFQGWDTTNVRRTDQVLHQDDNTSALGTPIASLEHINAQVRKAVESSSELRQAIRSVDHAPAEVMLTRWCADVSTYHLRFNGDWLDHSRSTPNSAKPSARP